jgi:hypothetical protein
MGFVLEPDLPLSISKKRFEGDAHRALPLVYPYDFSSCPSQALIGCRMVQIPTVNMTDSQLSD